MTTGMKQVLARLDRLEGEVRELQQSHAIDPDTIADEDDLRAIEDSEEDLRTGRAVTLAELKRKLKL